MSFSSHFCLKTRMDIAVGLFKRIREKRAELRSASYHFRRATARAPHLRA
jgi:hypothetical protein